MRILHISKFYPPEPGGIENFVYDLSNTQVKHGHHVYVLSHQTDFSKPTKIEIINGVTVIRVRTFGQLAYVPVAPEFTLKIRSVIRCFKPDIIHAHLPNISAFWLICSPKICPIVLHWHADVVASKIDRKMAYLYNFYKPLEKLLLKKADSVICTSKTYLNHSKALRKWLQKCRVVPLGLDPDRLNIDINTQKSPKKPAFTVLSVGRFTYYKGFEYLIDAAEKVPYTHFVLVGDGPGYHIIKARVDQKGLTNQVFLPGKLSQKKLVQLFKDSDIFCLPSLERTEAFGLVLLEAMYFGLPLITTAISGSGVNEVNQHGFTGLQVSAANAEKLAEAAIWFKKNTEKRLAMGNMAKKYFEANYTIENIGNKIERIYNYLLDRI